MKIIYRNLVIFIIAGIWFGLAKLTPQYAQLFPTLMMFPIAIIFGRVFKINGFFTCLGMLTASAVAGDLLLIAVDTSIVPNSHAFPVMELIGTAVFSILPSFLGLLIGRRMG